MRRSEYPFPVHMTDFVVLALCASALGTNVFEEGTAAEKKAAGTVHVYYFSGRRLMLDDLVLREDMDGGWALTESQRRILAWPDQWEEYGLGEYGPAAHDDGRSREVVMAGAKL